MSKNRPPDDHDAPETPKKREYTKIKKLPPLWKGDKAPKATEQTPEASPTSSGSETAQTSSGSDTTRISSGSETTRISSDSETPQAVDHSKVQFNREQWELNILDVDKGIKPQDPNFKGRTGKHSKTFVSAKDALNLDVKTIEKEMDRISQLFDKIDTIKQNPQRLRHFFADADRCAQNMKALEMPGAKEFQKSIDLAKAAYKTELPRAAYADSHKKGSAEKGTYEKSTDLPKLKK